MCSLVVTNSPNSIPRFPKRSLVTRGDTWRHPGGRGALWAGQALPEAIPEIAELIPALQTGETLQNSLPRTPDPTRP